MPEKEQQLSLRRDPQPDDPVDFLGTVIATATSRRGFLGGVLRTVVGLGLGMTFLSTGRAFASDIGGVGCAPQGSGKGTYPGVTSCGPPDKAGKYASKDNCHWNSTEKTDPSSNKYGCRPISGGFDYCKNVKQDCGNQDPAKPGLPTCPTDTTMTGYWTCCCDLKDKGNTGTTYTICVDCYPDAGKTTKKCTCLKAVPNGDPCKATP